MDIKNFFIKMLEPIFGSYEQNTVYYIGGSDT